MFRIQFFHSYRTITGSSMSCSATSVTCHRLLLSRPLGQYCLRTFLQHPRGIIQTKIWGGCLCLLKGRFCSLISILVPAPPLCGRRYSYGHIILSEGVIGCVPCIVWFSKTPAGKAAFGHELRKMSGKSGPDIFRSSQFTYEERGRRLSGVRRHHVSRDISGERSDEGWRKGSARPHAHPPWIFAEIFLPSSLMHSPSDFTTGKSVGKKVWTSVHVWQQLGRAQIQWG